MATSSLSKSFVISTKKEADALAQMFEDWEAKGYPNTFENTESVTVSHERLKEIIDAYRK